MLNNQKIKNLYSKTENGVRTEVKCLYNIKTNHITITSGFYKANYNYKYNDKSKTIYSNTEDGIITRVLCRFNTDTDNIGIHTHFDSTTTTKKRIHIEKTKQLFTTTTDGGLIGISCHINENTDHMRIDTCFTKSSDGGMENNKLCSQYLGIHIAERILSYIYTNVQRMNMNNPGYDFICGKGYKIDVKSSCLTKNRVSKWAFKINRNKIADYFLCLALNNREDLNPLHIWLIPGHIVNNKTGVTISQTTIEKWKEYKQPIDKMILCCNTLKGGENYQS